MIQFTLNGREVTVQEGDSERTLLEVLREEFGITSPKNGCAPQGQCGCCTVLIDGQARLSCALRIDKVAGRRVVTLEGVPEADRALVADCFTRAGGLQCGFCIPGIAVRALDLIEKNPRPTREEIALGLRQHLCRCTGYVKIIDAIEMMARGKRGENLGRDVQATGEPGQDAQATGNSASASDSESESASGRIGTRLNRYHSREFALGEWRYVDDLSRPGMLYAAPRLSDYPRALLRGIDPAPALALPGVRRVITAADVPGERYVGLIKRDWPVFVAIGEETRCVGDVVALAVADSPRAARRAAAAIAVDYEPRTPVATPDAARLPDAPRVHPNGNLLSTSKIKRGDVDAAFATAAHVVEDVFHTQSIEHMFLEPESCMAEPVAESPGSQVALRIYSQGQGVFDDRRQIAAMLAWPIERVEVHLVSNGGGFGGKEDMTVQAQTALAAVLCGCPVKCTLTREESMRVHPKRHPMRLHFRLACDADGHLTAVRARILGDTGAYASVGAKVLERAAGHSAGPYVIPNVDIEARAAYTNNPPCGAMRGFGVNQAAFAVENLLNRLARMVGIDAWEIRWRNILRLGDRFCTGQRMTKPFGLEKTLLAVRDAFRGARYAGIACGIKNVGIGNGMPDLGKALITVEAADRIVIRTGFTEMGQGLFTVCIQAACEETGLPPWIFQAATDTTADLNCGQTTASRGTVLAGNAVIDAAKKLRADLDKGLTPAQLIGRKYRGDFVCDWTTALENTSVEDPVTHITYGFATQVAILDDEGRVSKIIAAHDAGRVINPTMIEGQIQGSVHMGLGYALTEEFVTEGGYLVTSKVKDLGVLRAHQMPEVETIFIEEPDPDAPYGARGIGEIGLVPTAPAVAGALEAFDGIQRTRLPMKDSPAAREILRPQPARRASAQEEEA